MNAIGCSPLGSFKTGDPKSADELVSGGGKKPATLPGSKEGSLLPRTRAEPRSPYGMRRNLSGKAKFGVEPKIPQGIQGMKDRIEQNLFIENTREQPLFKPSLPDGWGQRLIFPDKKRNFFPRNHPFSSFPDRFTPPSCPPVFPEIFASLYTLKDDRIYIRLNADKVFARWSWIIHRPSTIPFFSGELAQECVDQGQLGWISIAGLTSTRAATLITGKGNCLSRSNRSGRATLCSGTP